MDDPRNTDNAWMETVAVNFHDQDGQLKDSQLQVSTRTGSTVDDALCLYTRQLAKHSVVRTFIKSVLSCCARFSVMLLSVFGLLLQFVLLLSLTSYFLFLFR